MHKIVRIETLNPGWLHIDPETFKQKVSAAYVVRDWENNLRVHTVDYAQALEVGMQMMAEEGYERLFFHGDHGSVPDTVNGKNLIRDGRFEKIDGLTTWSETYVDWRNAAIPNERALMHLMDRGTKWEAVEARKGAPSFEIKNPGDVSAQVTDDATSYVISQRPLSPEEFAIASERKPTAEEAEMMGHRPGTYVPDSAINLGRDKRIADKMLMLQHHFNFNR